MDCVFDPTGKRLVTHGGFADEREKGAWDA